MTSEDDPIKHVVLLILENHSFDQMLGCFKELYPGLVGIDPNNLRSNKDDEGNVYQQKATTERQMLLDPHHEVEHVAMQLSDNNGGFVRDFSESFPNSTKEARGFIMDYYPRGFLPGLHALASDFTICDHWHSSLPGPTWPNRLFALSGTSLGRVNMPDDGTHKADLAGYFQQDQVTLFDRLNEKGIIWKVYFHDIPQTTVFTRQREAHNAARYFYMDKYYEDARGPEEEFPQFCFIEPSYIGWGQNDDHPPHDIMRAEKLIANTYNALRANKELWRSTLLVVFYDEHGGFHDQMVPPKAIPPDDHHEEYSFHQFGVRVPALLVSPWVEKRVEQTQFDHTSLLKYLIEKWGLGPLGARAAAANSIKVSLTCNKPREDTIAQIKLTSKDLAPPDTEAEEKAFCDLNAHQSALKKLTTYLANEAYGEAPKAYSWIARGIEALKGWLDHILVALAKAPPQVQVSLAEPDRLAHHVDVKPRNEMVKFLMMKKRLAVKHLATTIRDETAPSEARTHALYTLGFITGRVYHKEVDGLEHAKGWLGRHGY